MPLRPVLCRFPCHKIPTSASKGLASLPPVLNTRFDCTITRPTSSEGSARAARQPPAPRGTLLAGAPGGAGAPRLRERLPGTFPRDPALRKNWRTQIWAIFGPRRPSTGPGAVKNRPGPKNRPWGSGRDPWGPATPGPADTMWSSFVSPDPSPFLFLRLGPASTSSRRAPGRRPRPWRARSFADSQPRAPHCPFVLSERCPSALPSFPAPRDRLLTTRFLR